MCLLLVHCKFYKEDLKSNNYAIRVLSCKCTKIYFIAVVDAFFLKTVLAVLWDPIIFCLGWLAEEDAQDCAAIALKKNPEVSCRLI